jgi:uncharacterized Zn finger protein
MARRTFGNTWWGKAWIEALETRARLDPNRLPRGRTYARHDRVSEMTVEPGVVEAPVQGSRRVPYRVTIRIRTFTEDEWERVLRAIVAKAAHAAALLDGDMDPGIVADARAAGVELFPTAGELLPRCSCPAWADPCKHSAAVCYLMADRLDDEPFDLLLLRGKERGEVVAGLRALRTRAGSSPSATAPPTRDTTMTARAAWQRTPGPLPAVRPPTRRPVPPAPWPVDPPPDAELDGTGLMSLATDSVERAWRMTTGEGGSGLDLDELADLARRAESALGTPQWEILVGRSGVPSRELVRRAVAWRFGRAAGVKAAAEAPWKPDARLMAEARQRLVTAGVASSQLRVDRNALIWGDTRVRLGHDGRWWRFAKRGGRWEMSAAPADDVDDLALEPPDEGAQ